MAPPPSPSPPGAGRPSGVVVVGVVVSLVSLDVVPLVVVPLDVVPLDVVPLDVVPLVVVPLVVVSLVVVRLVVVGDVVVFVLVDVRVVVFVGDVSLGGLDCELPPPQCWAFPLLPLLPQLPLSGFPPSPVLPSFPWVLTVEPPLPPESAFGPLPGTSLECVPPAGSEEDEGSAMAKAPPRPHRNRPEATRQADAAPCTREPTSSPPSRASSTSNQDDLTILAESRLDAFAVRFDLLVPGTAFCGR